MFAWAEVVGAQLAKSMNKLKVKFFISTDNEEVVKRAQKHFGKNRVITSAGSIEVCISRAHPFFPDHISPKEDAVQPLARLASVWCHLVSTTRTGRA
jgi:hypothetical protein